MTCSESAGCCSSEIQKFTQGYFLLILFLSKILGIQALLIRKGSRALGEPQEPSQHISKQENPIH